MESTESKGASAPYGYRFIRLGWNNATRMSEELANEMAENEEVAQMNSDREEVLILVRYPLEEANVS